MKGFTSHLQLRPYEDGTSVLSLFRKTGEARDRTHSLCGYSDIFDALKQVRHFKNSLETDIRTLYVYYVRFIPLSTL